MIRIQIQERERKRDIKKSGQALLESSCCWEANIFFTTGVQLDVSVVEAYRIFAANFFLERRPLSRQGRPTGIRITGSASFVPGAGVC